MHFAGKSYTLSLQNKKEGAGMAKQPKKLIANNKKVYHDYFLEETFEAGIALAGTEVKSMRMGKCSIKESFIRVENGEVYIYYASCDTRMHVATTTIDKLEDYLFNTPQDPHRSPDCVKQRCELISKNLELLKNEK